MTRRQRKKDAPAAVIVPEEIKTEEKASLDQSKVELIVEKTGEIKLADDHKILQSAFECIESDSLFKSPIKKSPLIKVVLLVSMRIEVGLDQRPSMNGINLKIVCRCCMKNVLKEPGDDD